ncbi:hypothetical protein K402DRAFT_396202 [Aulographum hederae CBS 113979]|uniref:Uncharacterized protein n=1 Tax=Aulographum hederae CBS 113979 TaxID=1176131 RepID=A0A6G1GT94_9PEZI|nr:hypothetical protein K402DRAFT_396202 [Aulographum hederae CBS 113979]
MVDPVTLGIALASAIAGCISAYKSGHDLLRIWREKREARNTSGKTTPNALRGADKFDQALQRARKEIDRERQRLSPDPPGLYQDRMCRRRSVCRASSILLIGCAVDALKMPFHLLLKSTEDSRIEILRTLTRLNPRMPTFQVLPNQDMRRSASEDSQICRFLEENPPYHEGQHPMDLWRLS